MKIQILLHSTTGNTKLVTRFAMRHLEGLGHECLLRDVAKPGDAPNLDDVDLLLVSGPTMYFRPTHTMERFVARLPNVDGRVIPTVLLATNGGDLGAHFTILAELLEMKGFITLGGHSISFPDNWPLHRSTVRKAAPAEGAAHLIAKFLPSSRPVLSFVWPDVGDVSPNAPKRLIAFLEKMLEKTVSGRDSSYVWSPKPSELPGGFKVSKVGGRLLDVDTMRIATNISIDPAICSRCGTCVKVCPVDCLSQEDDAGVPRVGDGCTGCWACYNRCPDQAIAGFGVPAGSPQYRGPSKRAREVFKAT